ncbi:lactosylceramide 4-alpha-galactosyltransferase-like isoform X1 [Parus major]|uniref:lactosylceramide 4-alpha-galactosyltransferase-like isoform X1 n=2 Tax=Parus major TaxID=9157 RepID=UPI000771135B|nr:lactosylceramide 4-alpha-galactosyltransferase-like isoform X1 [Parus major]XP_015484883.2 lactosylceramide 4-alpha-galactosyltransferase-like isoform X1 [Parus major]XP_015484885.1 lactosylceramide 4-alpha-galactosyltransferase-like isoform X1 [Parus major]XP_015484886.1 lactosylceramide 4-alpha-galactosyltransferase-like isoform X1 [Parus major]XP_015484890.1 lactosylceramide 4-alpha-galactosyltransferase-like isoform X1 [Parus major]XP_015484891.1 lactosylceramide 4-alpha-galactosyltrans
MGQAVIGEQAMAGERMLRMPSCLLKPTRVMLSHKPWALFILIFVFVSFAYHKLYSNIWEDPKSRGPPYGSSAEISCAHYVPSSLNIAGGPSPSTGSVFFVETSEQTTPSYLFSCSVESAARAHPASRVVVLMKGLAKENVSLPKHWAFSLLSCFPNVEIQPLDLTDLFSGTPLKRWYMWPLRHWEPHFLPVLSDACRIVLMWKFGGIYLDTDFIVLKDLQNLTDALGIQDDVELNGAFLSFKPKHKFMELCMQDFVQNYNGWVWGHQGPKLLTRVFKKWCSIQTIKSMSCKGVSALAPEVVYPIPWQDWKKLFEPVSALELRKLLKNTYAVHVWNKLSHGTKLEIPSQALLAQLYSQFCPATYTKMKQDSEELSRRAV